MAKITSYKTHRPIDPSDPGFTLPGTRLRWVSGRISETYQGRIWKVLRKSELPPELVKHIESTRPDAFAHGDTLRRYGTELTLAYATEEAALAHKRELKDASRELKSRINVAPQARDQKGRQTSEVFESSLSDATSEMINRFKKSE